MISPTLKRSPAETYGRAHLTPTAVVAGAFRRAWVRAIVLFRRDHDALKRVIEYSGDVDILLAQHDVRHARHVDGSRRVFKAPDLVYSPPAPRSASRGNPSAAERNPVAHEPGHHSRLFKPLR
jgi:hypothetical protein